MVLGEPCEISSFDLLTGIVDKSRNTCEPENAGQAKKKCSNAIKGFCGSQMTSERDGMPDSWDFNIGFRDHSTVDISLSIVQVFRKPAVHKQILIKEIAIRFLRRPSRSLTLYLVEG